MKLTGKTICSLIAPDFERVDYDKIARDLSVEAPVLFDDKVDADGHLVLVPGNLDPHGPNSSIYLCTTGDSVSKAQAKGLPTIRIYGDASFPRICNLVQSRLAAFERWDSQLQGFVNAYAQFQSLLDSCANDMGHPCALIDAQFRTICVARGHLPKDQFDQEIMEGTDSFRKDAVDLLMSSSVYGRLRSSRRAFPIPGTSHLLMRNLLANGKLIGTLVVYWDGDARAARRARLIAEQLGGHAEELYARVGSFGAGAEKPSLLRASLKHALEGKLEDVAAIAHMLEEDGHSKRARYILLRADRSFTNEGAEGFEYLARRLEVAIPGSYGVVARGAVYALVDMDAVTRHGEERETMRVLPALLREELVKAGASRTFTDMKDLEAARVQAEAALEQGSITDPTYWSYRFENYALDWILAHGATGAMVEYVVHPAMSILQRYDAAHDSELLRTLVVYVAFRYNVTAASKELFVARSTLLNRLDRIAELVAIDFDNLKERTYLAVSLALLKLDMA